MAAKRRKKVMRPAGTVENAARVRVAELPEPVKNQRSQYGLLRDAQFFAGSVDGLLCGFGSGRSSSAAPKWNKAVGSATSQKWKFMMRGSLNPVPPGKRMILPALYLPFTALSKGQFKLLPFFP